MRIVLMTGKGGVGKTTLSAATAALAAEHGRRTLVLSTDAAHSLGEVLAAPLGHEPSAVAAGLDAQQLDGRRRFEESWADIRAYLVELLGWAGADDVDASELATLPGLDEFFALENLRDHAASGRYDTVVVDCAPTAETLRLLALPGAIGFYLDRVFPSHRRLARVTRPVLRRTTSMPLADDRVFASLADVAERLEAVRALLADPTTTSVRLVATPESVVLAETQRTHGYLSLFGYTVDGLFLNRMLPADATGPLLDGMQARQRRALTGLDDGLAALPRIDVPLRADEVLGVDALADLGREIFGERSPVGAWAGAPPLRIERDAGVVRVVVPLPGVDRHEVRVSRHDGHLVVTAGPHRRVVALPVDAPPDQPARARFGDGVLSVVLGEAATAPAEAAR